MRWSIHNQISCGKVPPILLMLLMHWKQSTRSDFKSQLPYVPTFDVLEVEDKHSQIIIGAISPRKISLLREAQSSKNIMQRQAFTTATYSSRNSKIVDQHLVKYLAMKLKAS
jgi:crotonobetainyl-CoA:carnitine CoA-transferase CaiB-like acyl-CoA transferase